MKDRLEELEIASEWHVNTREWKRYDDSTPELEELRPIMCRFLVLANRGIDTSFGSLPMIRSMLRLLGDRVKYMKEKRKQGEDVKEEPVASTPRRGATGESARKRRKQGGTPEAPDVRGLRGLGVGLVGRSEPPAAGGGGAVGDVARGGAQGL